MTPNAQQWIVLLPWHVSREEYCFATELEARRFALPRGGSIVDPRGRFVVRHGIQVGA